MSLIRRPFLVLLASLSLMIAAFGVGASPPLPPGLDEHVASVMKAFEVPGLSLAVVKEDTVIAAKGYGLRKLGEPAPVDGRTLFGIASNTKAFTATALGLLVEEGKIGWDDGVIQHLPWFQLWDPYVTRELTIRDLLVHRSGLGLGAGDLLWWPPSTYQRREIAERLRFLRPVTSFRSAYAYDNVLYLVAGEVIEAVSGKTWEDFISSRILKKVGMEGSNVKHSLGGKGGNTAAPHARIDGMVRPISPFASDNTNPAGGINSNAEDMALWLRVQLAGGILPDGSRLFSPGIARQLTTMVTPIPVGDPPPEVAALKSNFVGYALGFGVRDYRGHKVVTHTGGLPGYVSKVLMIPGCRLGICVLTNQESSEAFDAITYWIADYYLGAPGTNWLEAYTKLSKRQAGEEVEADKRVAAGRDPSSHPSLALAKYAGLYRDAWYGDITLAEEKGRLVLRFLHTPQLVGELEPFQHDTFIVRWRDRELRADAFITFSLNPDGSIDQAKMQAVSRSTDFSFDFHDLLLKPVSAPLTIR